ncbi:hypothetical protein KM800_10275 [Clostridium tyrobutyricum]|uniref:hypothetical protein n=1 Tax=Clostridium tyrobutyricum TaxID=1519 RepID=UPI001C37ED98|nr:hypothetical protein [Clostridium tyrobutyricum]MBV4419703.1 hypothetical protein [Clostridium tyrobutyricum]
MSKHHRKYENNGFNLGDLLKNIDISQLMSILSSMGGMGGLGGGSKNDIGSVLNNLNLGDLGNGGNSEDGNFNDSNIKSKLSSLEKRLSSLENRNQMQNDLLEKVRELQKSPDAAKYLNNFISNNKRHK